MRGEDQKTIECPETESEKKLSDCNCFPKCEYYRDEQAQRIKELESGLRTVLSVSELWLPSQGELLLEEFAGEAQALCSMYSNLKELLKED